MSSLDPTPETLALAEAVFGEHREYLHGVAYRMLGTHSDTQDILQDAFLRLARVDLHSVEHARAYMAKMVTRLCLDHLRSARVRRETYVGPWLPEPIVDETSSPTAPDEVSALREDVSLALMFALEHLSSLERAAFLLHDVFDLDYVDVAEVLGRDSSACRQLVSRARRHLRAQRPRFAPAPRDAQALMTAFVGAAMSGDTKKLERMLADDAIFATDGGGKVSAATKVVSGPERIAKFVVGIVRKFYVESEADISPALVNGQPGFIVRESGRVTQAMSFDFAGSTIAGMYSVRNPEKLRHLNAGH